MVNAIVLHRDDETLTEEIPVNSSQSIGVVERVHFFVGGAARALRAEVEAKYGKNFPLSHAVYAWILRHAGWLTNRFPIGKDGLTAFQRYKQGEGLPRRDLRPLRKTVVEGSRARGP